MKQNVGGLDRWLRIVLGLSIIALGYVKSILWVEIIGAVVLLTGIFGFCGLYTILKINTAKKKPAKKAKGKKKK